MEKKSEIVEICLLAGKIMLESGAETYRVEDTMNRMAAAFGNVTSHSYVTPTAIMFSTSETEPSNLIRINERSTDLEKVTLVNGISRKISSGDLSLQEAKIQLEKLSKLDLSYPVWIQIFAAALASGCFTIMFLGTWTDFLPACVAGGVGFALFIYLHGLIRIKFFAEIMASFVIGMVAYLFIVTGIGKELDKIIIGSVMPLVPGLLITNAIRDLIAGHLVSGISKGAEAFLTALAIGTGIAVVLAIF
ncbi:threonine/serine exporter family protein [Bacillus timonensis]|uniref:threonine/serine exporter family protein n=1 Tax=Bacillus timonensis TaxID=1033734 RepID=UPI0002899A43|nr:threonine/serine exporter family protein [Bacillus timonensis]